MPTDPALLAPRVRPQAVLSVSLSTASCLAVDGNVVAVGGIDEAGASVGGRSVGQEHFLLLLRCTRSLRMKPVAAVVELVAALAV